MSYFVCLAVPPEVSSKLRERFSPRVHWHDASSAPIGRAAQGGNRSWPAYILLVSNERELPGQLLSGIQSMMADPACPSVSFVAHWMTGLITKEKVPVEREIKVKLSDLAQYISSIERNVRYAVSL